MSRKIRACDTSLSTVCVCEREREREDLAEVILELLPGGLVREVPNVHLAAHDLEREPDEARTHTRTQLNRLFQTHAHTRKRAQTHAARTQAEAARRAGLADLPSRVTAGDRLPSRRAHPRANHPLAKHTRTHTHAVATEKREVAGSSSRGGVAEMGEDEPCEDAWPHTRRELGGGGGGGGELCCRLLRCALRPEQTRERCVCVCVGGETFEARWVCGQMRRGSSLPARLRDPPPTRATQPPGGEGTSATWRKMRRYPADAQKKNAAPFLTTFMFDCVFYHTVR